MKKHIKKLLALSALLPALTGFGAPQLTVAAEQSLEEGFRNPPESAKPQTYWFWMNGNITKEGITADLEAMKRVGIGGVTLMEVDRFTPPGPVIFMSPEWNRMTRHAIAEAKRLGLDIFLSNCGGWSNSGGPWITPQQGMQAVVTSEQRVQGPARFSASVPRPQSNLGYYRDIALLAFRTPSGEASQMKSTSPKITGSGADFDAVLLMDGDLKTRVALPPTTGSERPYVQIEFSKPYAARTLTIAGDVPGHNLCELLVSDDGQAFKSIRKFVTADWRKGMDLALVDGVEPLNYRFYRLVFPQNPNIQVAELNLSDRLCVENFDSKVAHLRAHGYCAEPDYKVRGDNVATSAGQTAPGFTVQRAEVIDLTNRLTPEGRLDWDVPEGQWTLLRLGHTAAGIHNHVGPSGSHGLECDKFSKTAAEAQWRGLMQRVLDDLGPKGTHGLTGVHMDSWEVGSQNWTAAFPDEFRSRRGYDLRSFLPVLSNRIVDSPEVTERFLWDLRRTIGELFAENHYWHFTEMAHRNGLEFQLQAYGNGPMDDLPSSGAADIPMGHFWDVFLGASGSPACKLQSSAGHIYGRKIISAESYSSVASKWLDYPFPYKPIGDVSFCKGINRFVFCGPAHQPWPNIAPGVMALMAATHVSPNNTWWRQSVAWMSYLSRCQFLLQEGTFAADLCFLGGEDYLAGLQIPPSPALPAGYDYDLCDRATLLERMKFEDGFFTLPSGMRYRFLVLPDSKALTLPVVKKVRDLIAAGGTVIGPKPQFSPTLENYPACETEIRKIADEVWGPCDGKTVTENRFGKGQVIWGQSYADVFAAAKLSPDFGFVSSTPKANLGSIHRKSKDADWYFVASAEKNPVEAVCSFRVTGKQPFDKTQGRPEFWYPDTGKIEPVADYWMENGQTFVPISFDPCGSVFVVFRERIRDAGQISPVQETTQARGIEGTPSPLRGEGGGEGDGVAGVKKPLTLALSPKGRGNGPALQSIQELTGAWEVAFDPKWFYGSDGRRVTSNECKVVFEKLDDWSKRPEEAVKYFSGTAVYEKEFDFDVSRLTSHASRLFLDLGRVEVLAEVELNGKNLGILWKPPYAADITDVVKPGKNSLRVRVTNLWPNRLIGDEHLPADCEYLPTGALKAWPDWLTQNTPRTSGRRTFTTWRHWKAEDPLLPSGLLGPVRLRQ